MVAMKIGVDDQRALDAFAHGMAIFVDHDREFVAVAGVDARSFLQSLVSQDLADTRIGESVWSLLLQPQGKLIAWFRATLLADDDWLLDCDRGVADELLAGLARFKIRVKVDLSLRSDLARIVARGPNAAAAARPETSIAIDSAQQPTFSGFDWLGLSVDVDGVVASLVDQGGVMASDAVWESERIEHGVVVQGLDIDETTIAQEAGLETSAVSFTPRRFERCPFAHATH